MAKDYVQSVPRLKATPCQANPKVMIGISEKGGISVYGLQRFPITLYFEQWQMLLGENPTEGTVASEIILLGMEHADLLSDGRPEKATAKDVEDRTFTVTPAELTIVAAESARLAAEGDMAGAVKYATIKAVAEANKGKVSFEALQSVYQLKAKQ